MIIFLTFVIAVDSSWKNIWVSRWQLISPIKYHAMELFTWNLIIFRFTMKETYGRIEKKIKMSLEIFETSQHAQKIDTLYFASLKTI